MGLMDKAKNLFNKNKSQVSGGVDKATDFIDDKTGHKHTENLQKVDNAVDGITKKK